MIVQGSAQSSVIDLGSLPRFNYLDANLALLNIFDSSAPESPHRTPAERLELLKKCVVWASVFSEQANIQVLPSPQGGWSCSVSAEAVSSISRFFEGKISTLLDLPLQVFKPTRIFYDSNDLLSRPEPVVLGTLWHEVGHALFTDFRLFFEGQKIAQDEGYLPSSWALLANALEDPWINNRVMELSEVARNQLMALYRFDCEEIINNTRNAPLAGQLALNIVHYWYTGQPIPELDSRVQGVFTQLLPHINKFFDGKSSTENFDLLLNEIWPIYKTLENQAIKSEKREQLKKRIIRIVIAPPGAGGSGGSSRGSLAEANEVTISLGSDGAASNNQTNNELKDLLDSLPPEQREALNAAIKKALQEHQRRHSPNPADHASSDLPNFDLDTSAPHLRATLDRLSENLSAASQRNLERSAQQVLDNAQGELLNKSLPSGLTSSRNQKTGTHQIQFSESPPESKAQEIERRMEELSRRLEAEVVKAAEQLAKSETPRTEDEIQSSIKQGLRELDLSKSGFTPGEEAAYRVFKQLEQEMEKETKDMIRRLSPILPKKYETAPDTGHRSGSRIDIERLIRREPVGFIDFHCRKKLIQGIDPKLFVQLVIDRSGSMFPDKMPEALKTAIFWGRVCDAFGIPFAIKFFDHTFCRVKDFNQSYHNRKHRVKPNIVLLSRTPGGSTNMGGPLSVAYEEMKEMRIRYPSSMGALFVISDSGANDGLTGEPLRALIRRIQDEFLVGAFVLSEQEQDISMNKHYFGDANVVAPEHFSALPKESFTILRKTIVDFARKFS